MTKELEARLRAPAYWMCGSSEGHEGESTLPLKAADALQRYREASEWQPIDTHDGSNDPVDVWFIHINEGGLRVANRSVEARFHPRTPGCWQSWTGNHLVWIDKEPSPGAPFAARSQVTHWRPIPAPPTASG